MAAVDLKDWGGQEENQATMSCYFTLIVGKMFV